MAFSGGLNPHLQSAAECGPFAWLNNNVCEIPAFGSSVLLKFLTYQSLVGGENNTFAKSDIREAFVNLHFVDLIPASLRSCQPCQFRGDAFGDQARGIVMGF